MTDPERGEKGARGRRGRIGLRGPKGAEAGRLKLPRRVFAAWLLISIGNVAAFAWVYAVQTDLTKTQKVLTTAQSDLRTTQLSLLMAQHDIRAAQAKLGRVTGVVRVNQCDSLNRLAETKMFIASFLQESLRADGHAMPASKRRRYRLGIEKLAMGIASLKLDIGRLPACKLFPALASP